MSARTMSAAPAARVRRHPVAAAAVRGLSLAGEHGALWLAAGLAGAAADRARRAAWLRATALVAGAHVVEHGVKRVVRRPRPHLPAGTPPLVRTAGRHSFPSSHAASSAAAALAFGALAPGRAAAPAGRRDVRVPAGRRASTTRPTSPVGALLGAARRPPRARWTRTGSAGDESDPPPSSSSSRTVRGPGAGDAPAPAGRCAHRPAADRPPPAVGEERPGARRPRRRRRTCWRAGRRPASRLRWRSSRPARPPST